MLVKIITKVHQEKEMTILLVDQDVQTALDISEKAYILDNGRVAMGKESSLLRNDPEIKKAYLGL
jgi:branched-chain amino acid transport system ATP-binding protein